MTPRNCLVDLSIAAIAASALWLGCGVKSPPLPPQQVVPARITELAAFSQKDGIGLIWDRPDRTAGGGKLRDLGKFEIDRAEGNGEFHPIGEIPITDQDRFQQQRHFSYLDSKTELGHEYSYQVISETRDGYRSEPSNSAGATRVSPKPTPNPENFVLPQPTPLP